MKIWVVEWKAVGKWRMEGAYETRSEARRAIRLDRAEWPDLEYRVRAYQRIEASR